MKILLLAHFVGDREVAANNRFDYLAQFLSDRGHDVELVTSDFSHTRKQTRDENGLPPLSYTRTLINEPGYARNVSLQRVKSHRRFAANVEEYLNNLPSPDIIYCAVPSLDLARAACNFANIRKTRLVLDINDLWPEAFSQVSPIPALTNILFHSASRKADRIYACADAIVAVSQTYADRANRQNPDRRSEVVYLGTDLEQFDNMAKAAKSHTRPDAIWLGYCGTLGHSYDLPTVFSAMSKLPADLAAKTRLIVMGDGPLFDKFQNQAQQFGVNAEFLGRLPYGEMVSILCQCSIAVNPIAIGAAGSIINKHADYAAAGIPVINTQESPEYRRLVEAQGMGFNCQPGDADGVMRAIVELHAKPENARTMGANSRKAAETLFDRRQSYTRIACLLEEMV